MSKIKTKETVKDIRVFDKAGDVTRHMKDAFIRAKDTTENLSDDGQVSPSEYAEDKVKYAAEGLAEDTGHPVSSGTKKAVNKGKEAYYQHRKIKKAEQVSQDPAASVRQTETQMQRAARNQARRNVNNIRQVRNQTIKTTQQTERTI